MLKTFAQGGRALRIVSTVKHEPRIVRVQHLKSCRPRDGIKPRLHCLIVDIPPLLAQNGYRFEHRCGILQLMLAEKRNGVACTAIRKHLTVDRVKLNAYIVKVGNIKLGAHLAAHIAHDLHRFAKLLIHDDCRAVFYYSGLFVGNFGQRSAENSRVIKSDVGNDAALRAGDDVCRVVSAAETDFKYHDIAAGIGKPAQSRCRHHLKLRWVLVHGVRVALYFGDEVGKRVILYLLAVYLHALVEAAQIRRGVKSGFEACPVHYGCKHCTDAALSVGARNVDKFKLRLRIAHPCKKLAYSLKTEPRAAP